MRKRALTREVSMSTGFKGKTKNVAATTREKDKRAKPEPRRVAPKKSLGVTLVEATPVNREEKRQGRSQASLPAKSKGILPSMFESSKMSSKRSQKDDEDDDDNEWTVNSSPDILLLNSVDDDVEVWETPTKPKRKKN